MSPWRDDRLSCPGNDRGQLALAGTRDRSPMTGMWMGRIIWISLCCPLAETGV